MKSINEEFSRHTTPQACDNSAQGNTLGNIGHQETYTLKGLNKPRPPINPKRIARHIPRRIAEGIHETHPEM